jgi:hypothetical protein
MPAAASSTGQRQPCHTPPPDYSNQQQASAEQLRATQEAQQKAAEADVSADVYLHRPAPPSVPPPSAASQYAGHIVQWNGDRNPQKTAWLVGPDGKRYWIPTIAIYWCLKEQGHAGPDILPAATLEQLPDSGQSATCSGGRGGGGSEPLPHTEPPSQTPPPPPTFAETVGGVTHTWTNYTNAGGTQGPSIFIKHHRPNSLQGHGLQGRRRRHLVVPDRVRSLERHVLCIC